ncbi:glycosyltransferase [Saccharopolyspora gregorii]|uniref:Glycosyltransferase n=1 Tax=Saccharopolyspora gregorii TaxID=33914 RepID=A0ABP6RU83_9PSEU
MRALLATTGTRGEVQPLLALARALLDHGHRAQVAVPPDFRGHAERLGVPALALGPPMRGSDWDLTTDAGRRRAAEDTVAAQFAVLPAAAAGADVLVGAGSLAIGVRSAAELAGTRYVHVHYCPATLPSPRHPPAPWPGWPQHPAGGNAQLWAADERRWDTTWGEPLRTHRAAAGLPPIGGVRAHVFGDRPWLAADPVLGPWPGDEVHRTGAWLLPEHRPLPPEVVDFLDNGDPPVHFGLGSRPAAADDLAQAAVEAARRVGRRAIISRGWAGLDPPAGDHLVVDDLDHQVLFPHVAAAVHHGGAGTSTAAARAGIPQVLLPEVYDQHYWARRVTELGIGAAHPGTPTADSLAAALRTALTGAERARHLASRIRTDGARIAARDLARPG